ncbi:hypothetical protein HMPREF9371_2174 [Neisseria shayeganii 871]|uniref:Uncharacterized protein n=1 Tax=Neisseria shayeganii 871 TaxID=1032488 RepID=G4CKN4_9NEIS|nr:hypothetical protein HMPREF9371_2174 [Neisseria shayeganii 871]
MPNRLPETRWRFQVACGRGQGYLCGAFAICHGKTRRPQGSRLHLRRAAVLKSAPPFFRSVSMIPAENRMLLFHPIK